MSEISIPQMLEFWAQVRSGRITRESFQAFLEKPSQYLVGPLRGLEVRHDRDFNWMIQSIPTVRIWPGYKDKFEPDIDPCSLFKEDRKAIDVRVAEYWPRCEMTGSAVGQAIQEMSGRGAGSRELVCYIQQYFGSAVISGTKLIALGMCVKKGMDPNFHFPLFFEDEKKQLQLAWAEFDPAVDVWGSDCRFLVVF